MEKPFIKSLTAVAVGAGAIAICLFGYHINNQRQHQQRINYAERLFFELLELGKIPVIVHPERNAHFREDPNHLLPFLDMGCLAQLTAPSYVGVFGKDIQKTAKTMVKHNLVQMAASDAHGVSKRTFYLKECYEQIAKDFSKEKVVQMKQVAKDLINGDEISYPIYEEVKKKKFGLF